MKRLIIIILASHSMLFACILGPQVDEKSKSIRNGIKRWETGLWIQYIEESECTKATFFKANNTFGAWTYLLDPVHTIDMEFENSEEKFHELEKKFWEK